eukprot:TRINITY_DN31146_c0_g1_i1.p2 TRINITY_DN31146_c0_g1~~TRINITY_DN31146_c0_g1_i1.p2  ORF type:complete len:370 (-),score=74.29 TRINITY_DN31146_c0_g1_i1:82-1131(-)
MASLSYYQGGEWVTEPYDRNPRKPQLEITHATDQLVKFTLYDTDISMANAVRRVIMAEVPTMAVEIVNVEDNDSVLFDEFIAHRIGLLPLSCTGVGDIPPDDNFGFREHRHCNCFDGCPYCTVEFKLDVCNTEDKVLNVTHFDIERTNTYVRDAPKEHEVQCVPLRDESKDFESDSKDNGILITKLKQDQRVRMVFLARKGIPKYHAKFMPVATCSFRYQNIVTLDEAMVSDLTLDEGIEFVESCPRHVFTLENDRVKLDKLDDCIQCDECSAKAKELGKKGIVTIKHDPNRFYFTVESVTPDGPRSVIDVVRAAIRVLDYKYALFTQDTFGDEITEYLPYEPQISAEH